jgi:hypothetical protein
LEEKEECKTDGIPRFKQKTDTSDRLFNEQVDFFTYDDKNVDSVFLSIQSIKTPLKPIYQLVVRSLMGNVLFTGYIKKKSVLKENPEPNKNQSRQLIIFVIVRLLVQFDNFYSKDTCFTCFYELVAYV